ncbi:MAG: preprotein translocase subunit SecG, partial [Flavobacterium sp.]
YSVFLVLIVVVCLLLTLVIMVQNPKGGGLSSSFGAGTNQLGGVQKTTDFLDRSTWILGFSLIFLILLSAVAFDTDKESILVDDKAPVSAPAPAKKEAKPATTPVPAAPVK